MNFLKHIALILLLSLMVCLLPAYGQSSLHGEVLTSSGGHAAGATVHLMLSKDSVLVRSSLTSDSGSYRFDHLKPGKYIVSVSFQGYRTIFSPLLELRQQTVVFHSLSMQQEAHDLSTVTIVSSRAPYQKFGDRMVVNVSNTVMAAGGTALEVLERSPGVVLDKQNNSISVGGKNGVSLMINGKAVRMPQEVLLKMLETMSASNIDKVEFIGVSAKEDAEGAGGIINIILKKREDEGTNGSFYITGGLGKYEKSAAGFNINHRSKKLNIYGDLSPSWNRAYSSFDNYRDILNNGKTVFATANQSIRQAKTLGINGNLGLDYELNPQTAVGASLYSFLNRPKLEENGQTVTRDILHSTTITNIGHQEVNQWTQFLLNFNIRHTFSNHDKLSADIDYLHYNNKNPHTYTFDFYPSVNSDVYETTVTSVNKYTPIKFWVGRLDYARNPGKGTLFETGIKGSVSTLDNDISVKDLENGQWVNDGSFSQSTNMKEYIGAVYSNFKYEPDTRTQFTIGLRYEYTHTSLNSLTNSDLLNRKYGNLFPSIIFSRSVSEDNSISFSYSRRITRPTYKDLAPYVHFVDPSTFISGNLYLKPVISDIVEGNFRLKNKYLFTLSYNYSKDAIVPYQVYVDTLLNTQNIRAENMKDSRVLSLGITLPVKIARWWNIQSTVVGMYGINNLDYQSVTIKNKKMYVNFNVIQTLHLSEQLSGEVTGMYQSKSPFGMGYLRGSGAFSAGLKKQLQNNSGTLRLTVTDLFWNTNFSIVNNQHRLNFTQSFKGVFSEPRVVRLTYTRDFGNSKLKQASKREVGSKEERNRTN